MAEPKKETVRMSFPQRPEQILQRPPVLPLKTTATPLSQPLPKPAEMPLAQAGPATSLLPSAAGASMASGSFARFSVSAGPLDEVTSSGMDGFDSIPRWFCWGLLGLSALIFLIQIWNYAVS